MRAFKKRKEQDDHSGLIPTTQRGGPGHQAHALEQQAEAAASSIDNNAIPEQDLSDQEQNPIIVQPATTDSGVEKDMIHMMSGISGESGSLDRDTGNFMSARLQADFDNVTIHTGQQAEELSQLLQARAFTWGSNIFFNKNEYQPQTNQGRQLLAHELVHTRQQHQSGQATIQRNGFGDIRIAEDYRLTLTKIQNLATYKALAPADKKRADDIIAKIDAMSSWSTKYSLILKLKLLFETTEDKPEAVAIETKTRTADAVKDEKKRMTKPAESRKKGVEEKASEDKSRKWESIKGKFGGGSYQVDRSDPTNIIIKAKIYLKPAGSGTVDDVKSIKSMEDAIEKAASIKGFAVDVEFVDTATADAFTVTVDPSKWMVATNWSGGTPRGFAHELFHLLAYELDRYDYIAGHSTNTSMLIADRLIWFEMQLTKPADWDNPASIMGHGEHPLEDDVCRIAGLDMVTCLTARKKVANP
jgi:hypothetical protein